MIVNNSFTEIDQSKLVIYDEKKIKLLSTPRYEPISGYVYSALNKLGAYLTSPLKNGLYWGVVANSDGEEVGAGGARKKYSWLKAAGWLAAAAPLLPLTPIGFLAENLAHPGRGADQIKLVDATKDPEIAKSYKKPTVRAEDPLPMMTYNVAWTPSPMDVMLDVTEAAPRAQELAKWLKKQHQLDIECEKKGEKGSHLPLVIGMQEAFSLEATEAFSEEVKELYPFAVTGAGWTDQAYFGDSSGLQVYSRLPMKNVQYYPFQDLEGLCARSARGFLRVEVELNEEETAIVYVTHTQAFEDEHNASIRANELTLIANQARRDREESRKKGARVRGYYLMGDLNVERSQYPSRQGPEKLDGSDVEYWRLYGEDEEGNKGPLHPELFYDPFYEDHDLFSGERNRGEAAYLESDTNNSERVKKGWDPIKENSGSFYRGAYMKKQAKDYGTEGFFKGPQAALENGRLDFILELVDELQPFSEKIQRRGEAELRNVILNPLPKEGEEKSYPVSDHLPLHACWYGKKEKAASNSEESIGRLNPPTRKKRFFLRKIQRLFKKLEKRLERSSLIKGLRGRLRLLKKGSKASR